MDRQWILKRDFDPILIGNSFLRAIRCTVYRCPCCKWICKLTWEPSSSFLGPGSRKCWHCDQIFWDGSNEWAEMTAKQQRLVLMPITIIGYLGAFLVILGLVVWESISTRENNLFDYMLFFSVFAPPLLIWFGIRARQLNRSIRRYNERGEKVSS
jgi:hypothetical protein